MSQNILNGTHNFFLLFALQMQIKTSSKSVSYSLLLSSSSSWPFWSFFISSQISHINSTNKYTLSDVLSWNIYVIYCSILRPRIFEGGENDDMGKRTYILFCITPLQYVMISVWHIISDYNRL